MPGQASGPAGTRGATEAASGPGERTGRQTTWTRSVQMGPSQGGARGGAQGHAYSALGHPTSVCTGGCARCSKFHVRGEGLSPCPQANRGPERSGGSEPLNSCACVPTRRDTPAEVPTSPPRKGWVSSFHVQAAVTLQVLSAGSPRRPRRSSHGSKPVWSVLAPVPFRGAAFSVLFVSVSLGGFLSSGETQNRVSRERGAGGEVGGCGRPAVGRPGVSPANWDATFSKLPDKTFG